MVQLTKEEMAIYEALATNGHKMTEDAQAMVAVIRCKQFCDHPSLIDEKCKSSKLEALKEVLQEVILDNGHKVLIFTQYAQMAARLLKEFDAMGLKYMYLWGETPKKVRADMQQQFTDDKSIDLMIGTEAMSQGLNFTAADYVVNYDDNWAPAIMRQRADRAHRIGQKNVVTVVNFICRNTIEERIRDVLLAKDKVSAQGLGDDTDVAVIKRLGPQDIAKML
jgi:SNF2 family DNA or RNA helicase